MAPTGLIRSWQTREHSSAARSRASGAEDGQTWDVFRCGADESHYALHDLRTA